MPYRGGGTGLKQCRRSVNVFTAGTEKPSYSPVVPWGFYCQLLEFAMCRSRSNPG